MFNKLRDRFQDKTVENLCNHLVNLGIDAELVEKGAPDDIGETSRFPIWVSDMGSIRVIGKDIDIIQVTKYSIKETGPSYGIDYTVKGHIEGKEESVTAKTKLNTKGFTRRQVVDFIWMGGELAELLNEDRSLKESILQEQILQLGADVKNIEIKPDQKKPYIRIRTGGKFPSEKGFECYNTIAKHICQLLQ